jgi:hypothetical protein
MATRIRFMTGRRTGTQTYTDPASARWLVGRGIAEYVTTQDQAPVVGTRKRRTPRKTQTTNTINENTNN